MRWEKLTDTTAGVEFENSKIIFEKDSIGYNLICTDLEDNEILKDEDIDLYDPENTIIDFIDRCNDNIDGIPGSITILEKKKFLKLSLPELETEIINYMNNEEEE